MLARVVEIHFFEGYELLFEFIPKDEFEFHQTINLVKTLSQNFSQVEIYGSPISISIDYSEEFIINFFYLLMLKYNIEIMIGNNIIKKTKYTPENYNNLFWILRDYTKLEILKINLARKKFKRRFNLIEEDYIEI